MKKRVIVRNVGALVLGGLLLKLSPAEANPNLNFDGGPIVSPVIDIVCWECSQDDQTKLNDYLDHFSSYINGYDNPFGLEAAVRYYGIYGAQRGQMYFDTTPIQKVLGTSGRLGDEHVKQEILNTVGTVSPTSSHLYLLVVGKDRLPNGLVSTDGSTNVSGWHDSVGSQFVYGVVDSADDWKILSHEIEEAMTDPEYPDGWRTSEGFLGLTHWEGSDQCGISSQSPAWTSSVPGASSGDITGISDFTLNAASARSSADTCQLYQRAEHAPLTAIQLDGSHSVVFYRTPDGTLGVTAQGTADLNGPFSNGSLGTPSPSLRVVGKPSIVDLGDQNWIAVTRVSDGTLYYFDGSSNWGWRTMVGFGEYPQPIGQGDPSCAAIRRNTPPYGVVCEQKLLDERIWRNVSWDVHGGKWGIWTALISSPPDDVASPPVTYSTLGKVHTFIVGRNGHLNYSVFTVDPSLNQGTDTAYLDLGAIYGDSSKPLHALPGVVSWNDADRLDVFGTWESGVAHTAHEGTGVGWSGWGARPELQTAPAGSPSVTSWGNGRMDAVVCDRFGVLRHTWYERQPDVWGTANEVIATNCLGDPTMIAPSPPGNLNVFYWRTDGFLGEVTWRNQTAKWTVSTIPGAVSN